MIYACSSENWSEREGGEREREREKERKKAIEKESERERKRETEHISKDKNNSHVKLSPNSLICYCWDCRF